MGKGEGQGPGRVHFQVDSMVIPSGCAKLLSTCLSVKRLAVKRNWGHVKHLDWCTSKSAAVHATGCELHICICNASIQTNFTRSQTHAEESPTQCQPPNPMKMIIFRMKRMIDLIMINNSTWIKTTKPSLTVILAPVASLIRTICLRNSGP